MLNLVHHRGLLSGKNYATALLRPGCATPRPACPYWCPLRWLVWHLAFSAGAAEVLYGP